MTWNVKEFSGPGAEEEVAEFLATLNVYQMRVSKVSSVSGYQGIAMYFYVWYPTT